MHWRAELPLESARGQAAKGSVRLGAVSRMIFSVFNNMHDSRRVVVVLEFKIYVYNFADLKLLDHIEKIGRAHV